MANVPRTEFHEKLSDLTECSICAEVFTNPKTLPCIHTFCLHCLEKYGKDKSPGNPMACPICRNEFFIPQEGFSSLPNNFFIGKIVEVGKLAAVTAKEAVCDLCFEQSSVAKKFCIDCQQKLCDRCNMSHSRIKHCQSHQVVKLGNQLNMQQLNLRNSYCEHHPKELIKMFCHEDNVAICLICFAESHQSHKCSNVDKAAGQFNEQLKDDLRKIVNRRPEVEEAFHKFKKFKTEFAEEVLKTEDSIRKSGTQLKELIDQHMEELVQNLKLVRDRNLKYFETTKQDVDRFKVMIDSYQRYCDELLTRGSPVDICRAASQMHTRASDLEKLPVNCSVDDFYCEKISFHAANLEMRMKQHGINNIVGELTVAKSTDRNVKFHKSISVSVPCESVGVLKRFVPMDLGAVDIITKYMKFELQKIEAELKECSGSIDTAMDEPGFIIRGNETGVGKVEKNLLNLTDRIIMYDHEIDRPGIPAYFYSKHGKEVLRGIQTIHKVSIQLDNTQERAKPQAVGGEGPEVGRVEMTPGKFMIPTRRDTIDVDGVFNAANVELRRYGGVADLIVRPDDQAGATKRTRTIADPHRQSEKQREERQPQYLSRIILSIYALSKKAIDEVLKDIEAVIKEYIIDKLLNSQQDQENIAKLNPEQVKRIKDIADIYPVQIEVETGRLKRIRIRGPPVEVTAVMDLVHEIFQESHMMELKKKEGNRITNAAHWEYEDGNHYENYPDEINAIIETAFRDKKPYAEWDKENAEYRLTFQTMVEEVMTKLGTLHVKVRRVANEMDVPANWETMKHDEDLKRILLKTSDQEYKDVAKAVFSTAQTSINRIVKIERIQNKYLYKQYVVRKAAMDAANPGVQNEITLWHGAGADTLDSINQSGFNRSYCGKNAVAYGRGVYFAKNFSYSAQSTYSPPDTNGFKHIYQCKVLTGEYAMGNTAMIVPPPYPGSTTKKYDSTVDNVTTPTIFVIYNDTQAYPEYLIYFK